MLTDDQIRAFYETTFGPLRNPSDEWLRDALSWCRRVLEAETLDAAAQAMATWAADGDRSSARASAAALRQAAGIHDDVPAPPPPRRLPPQEVQIGGARLLALSGWRWWQDHRLPVWVEEGPAGTADWRRVFADGELIRAWRAAGWAILPDTTDSAVQGWALACARPRTSG